MSGTYSPRATTVLTGVGLAVATSYAAVIAWTANWMAYGGWIALVLVPAIVLANVALVLRVGRRDPDPRFVTLLMTAFVLKLLATVARYLMAFVLYNGASDANQYHKNGERLAEAYRQGMFGVEVGRDFIGTGFMRIFTGALYTITGPSIFVAFTVFSIIGFWGLYFAYRAFRVGVPDGDARRYALLVLLLPSMLFWPASVGKESWMCLGIGLAAYGCALLSAGDRRFLMPLLLGLAATAVVRPHITAALAVATTAAFLFARSRQRSTELTPVVRGLAAAAMLAGLFVVSSHAASFLGVGDLSVSSLNDAVQETTELTDEGGSAFVAHPVRSPLDFPMATLTVLFRPFVFEVTNPQMMLAALEGSLLLLLFVRGLPRLRAVPARLRRQPYLIFCLVYAALFVYAFSNFSNFGILTRERVMVLPFVLVLLALPKPHRTTSQHHSTELTSDPPIKSYQGEPA